MCRRNVGRGTKDVFFLVVEKNVRAQCFQDWRFRLNSDEMHFICRSTPCAQRVNNAFMSWRIARSDYRNTYFTFPCFIHVFFSQS